MGATGITASPALGTPIVHQVHTLGASGTTAAAILGTPAVCQNHALTTSGITVSPVLGTPALSGTGGGVDYSLIANPLNAGAPSLGTPVLDPWSWGIGRYPWTAIPALSIGLLSSSLSMLPWTAIPALDIEMVASPAEIRVRLVEDPV